jgi:hypothetical protein
MIGSRPVAGDCGNVAVGSSGAPQAVITTATTRPLTNHLVIEYSFTVVYSVAMERTMHPPWFMGHIEWLELGLFGLFSVVIFVLLTQCRQRQHIEPTATQKPTLPVKSMHWRSIPEIQLLVLALPLELLWEVAQFPLYTVWHEGDWSYISYGLAHCTLGDLIILLVAYWIVALLNRNRHWYLNNILPNGALFLVLGAVYTIYSEISNVRIKGTWDYTDLMPIVPVADIGAMPFLQWILIPPVLLWLMRLLTLSPDRP